MESGEFNTSCKSPNTRKRLNIWEKLPICRVWGMMRPPWGAQRRGRACARACASGRDEAGRSEMTRSESGVVWKLALRVGRAL